MMMLSLLRLEKTSALTFYERDFPEAFPIGNGHTLTNISIRIRAQRQNPESTEETTAVIQVGR